MENIYLKSIPSETVKYIRKIQGEIKIKKNVGKYSLSATVIKIVNEHQEFTKSKK